VKSYGNWEMSNEDILRDIEAGNVDRDRIFADYKGLGEVVDTRGLNFNEKRLLALGQYFTPYPVVKFVTDALNLSACVQGTFLDNSCGMGRMFRYLPPTAHLVGVEIEENAFKASKALFPKATLAQGDLINYILPTQSVDFALLNPPFSIRLEKRDSGLLNAQWGVLGPRSSVLSHIAAIEIAIRATSYVVACVVPSAFFVNETTRVFERWITMKAKEIMRVYLPPDIYPNAHVDTAIVMYDCRTYLYPGDEPPFTRTVKSLADLDTVLREWHGSDYYRRIEPIAERVNNNPKSKLELKPRELKAAFKRVVQTREPAIARYGSSDVTICLSPANNGVLLKADNLLTALKVADYQHGLGEVYNKATQEHLTQWDLDARRQRSYYNGFITTVERSLRSFTTGEVRIDPQVQKVQKKAARWLARQKVPFEQWIQCDNGIWDLLNETDGITSRYPRLYQQKARELDRILFKYPRLNLWNWQKHDVIRIGMKQHTLLATDMGLGKTRMGIAAGLLSGCKHILIVTEPKLVGQFAGELRQFGCDFKVINNYWDTKTLRQFNLIGYSKLWSKATKSKTFAKALNKQVEYVILDEAHNIKANDSRRAVACRSLHPRHWLLMSGTPIANYPRNIFSLLVCAFGDATELFEYGYWNPYSPDEGYCSEVTSGTRGFKEDFVTISTYVSHQFEATLDKGIRRREFPIVKDLKKWHKLLAPMMIRRCRDEPEVMAEVKIPDPIREELWVTPSEDHIEYYRLWLDAFAEWFLAELKSELDGNHKMDMIMLLVQIGKLQFISTIPQSEKVKSDKQVHYNWNGNLTKKQEEVLRLAMEHSNQHKKVIVYSERPELQYLLHNELTRRGIRSLVFTGEQPIQQREEVLRDFKVRNYSVLLATTSVGGTGLNIPQASVVIFADQSWTPQIHEQAIARVCRPQQTKQPLVIKIYNRGMIDEYMKQMMEVKQEGISEAIDHQAHTFDPANWLTFRDMSYRYLKAEGYM
jgi:SNF2 family DNA or RNA helicase